MSDNCPVKRSGLTIQETDCEITRAVRAGFYVTDITPTVDDVLNIAVAVEEDVVLPLRVRVREAEARVAELEAENQGLAENLASEALARQKAIAINTQLIERINKLIEKLAAET